MAIRIEIYTVADAGPEKDQVEQSMAAIGFARRSPSLREVAEAAHDEGFKVKFAMGADGQTDGAAVEQDDAEATAPKRERGKPAPGKARRTKEEIAEDDAAAAAETGEHGDEADPAGRIQQGISSGEERVGPEDDAETQAQDKADEQAEVDAQRKDDKPLTVDDVKAAVNAYVSKYGLPATQEDGPKIFVEALGKPPEGEAYWKMSLLADATQEQLSKTVTTWNKATELNPLKREAV